MLKRILKSNMAVSAIARLLSSYIRFVYYTSRVITEPNDKDAMIRAHKPFIVASWHGQLMMMPIAAPPKKEKLIVRPLVARHGDGAIVDKTLRHLGLFPLRGAGAAGRKKDRGGARALRESVRALGKEEIVFLSADVPPGPWRKAGPGIITMARLSGRPILPAAAVTSRRRTMNTWDRFTINLPFSKLSCVMGEPIYVPRDLDEAAAEKARLGLENELNRLMKRAYELVGETADQLFIDTEDQGKRTPPGFRLKAYRLLTNLARPIAPLILSWRIKRGKEDSNRQNERYGISDVPRPQGKLLWFHAASVGETHAILPVITAITDAYPDVSILLTTGTVTSGQLAQDRLPPRAIHQYVPLDAPKYVARFLNHWQPDLALFTESEIWPNLILQSSERNIPLMLLNGRMSRSSYRSWRRQAGLSRPLFSCFDLVLAQNDRLANRFRSLGAPKTIPVGNLKIDCPALPIDQEALSALQKAINGRPIFTAASTHPGEDEIIADAHLLLKQDFPDLLTILIPRHPERGQAISSLLQSRGLGHSRRSQGAVPQALDDIYIADTIGELGTLYSLSDAAFIGGSAIPHGGQNPVEAVKMGTAVLTGPHWHNFKDAYQELIRLKGCKEVHSAEDIAQNAKILLRDENHLNATVARANEAVSNLSGALEKTLDAISPHLLSPQAPQGMRRAS